MSDTDNTHADGAPSGVQGARHDVMLCGWRMRSEIPFPEAQKWNGAADHPVDIDLRLGPVSFPNEQIVLQRSEWAMNRSGDLCFRMGRLTRVLFLRERNHVIIDTPRPVDTPFLRLPVLTRGQIQFHQSFGCATLHGGAVVIDGRAWLILGRSGRGKTTLTGALAQRGYHFLTEEHCVIEWRNGPGTGAKIPYLRPVLPSLRLTQGSAKVLGIDWQAPTTRAKGAAKGFFRCDDWFDDQARPVGGVIVLPSAEDGTAARPAGLADDQPYRLSGSAGLFRIVSHRSMPKAFPDNFDRVAEFARWCLNSGNAWCLPVSWGLDTMDQGIESVVALARHP